jgi:hypothetical protein
MVCLLAIYVGGTYGGSYASILINIPGTAAAAATALDGYPLACKGEGGRAIGLTTTASAIGTTISMLFVVSISPIISHFALQFTSFEFFLLAFFGILISGTLTSPDLVIKGWIAGFLGLFLACVGRDLLQFYPRFTFGIPNWTAGSKWCPCSSAPSAFPRSSRCSRTAFRSARPRNCSASSGNRHGGAQHPGHWPLGPDRRRHRRRSRHRRGHRRLGLLRHGQEYLQTPGNLRQRENSKASWPAKRPTTPAWAAP